MTAQSDADDALRESIGAWLEAYDRGIGAGELLVDFASVVQIRSYGDAESTWDRYELITPSGVALHSAKGLLMQGLDIIDAETDGDDDD